MSYFPCLCMHLILIIYQYSSSSPLKKITRCQWKTKLRQRVEIMGWSPLESAHICLINATGTEILKNIVLPGIGAFTILDSQMVSVSDLDSNFFVTSDKVGTSRAACTTQLLCELNTEVRSNICTELLDTILDTSPQFFSQFTVVIATDISEEKLKCLAEILWMRFFYAYRLPLDVNAIIHLDT